MGTKRPDLDTAALILPIRGMFFQKEGRKLRRRLVPGYELLLKPVPRDEFVTFAVTKDSHAVEILSGEKDNVKLGYIPATHSQIVRNLIEEDSIESVKIFRVRTDNEGHWRVSLEIRYIRRTANEDKIERVDQIMRSMQVPSREYAVLIAATTAEGSLAEEEWIEVYNETCFEG